MFNQNNTTCFTTPISIENDHHCRYCNSDHDRDRFSAHDHVVRYSVFIIVFVEFEVAGVLFTYLFVTTCI